MLPSGTHRELREITKRKSQAWRAFGIEVNGAWCESCICGDALELASEALNGTLWMGSYLQGSPFGVIRKHYTATLALIEQGASRPHRQGWKANLQEMTAKATSDILSFSERLAAAKILHNKHTCKH